MYDPLIASAILSLKPAFAHGDTVQLKSGGLPMMIVEVYGGMALCYYVYEGDVVREWWPVVSLVSVPKPTHL